MSQVVNLGRQLGLSQKKVGEIIKEMKSSDYEDLVKVFAKNFGMVVDIYNNGVLYDWQNA
jgi:hypothetical protein